MKATREQVTEMLVQTGLIEPGCWLVEGNKYEALVHLAQQFTLDQLRAQDIEAYICTNIISDKSELARVPVTSQHDAALYSNAPLYLIPETLE